MKSEESTVQELGEMDKNDPKQDVIKGERTYSITIVNETRGNLANDLR